MMTKWMRPPDADRFRTDDRFDPIAAGVQHRISRELALAIWAQVCAEAREEVLGRGGDAAKQRRFHELAVRAAGRAGGQHIDVGRQTRVELESGHDVFAWHAAALSPRVPGRTTLAEPRGPDPSARLDFDDYRVQGLGALLQRLGPAHPLRPDLIAASVESARTIAGRATRWREPLSGTASPKGHALWGAAERHAAMLYRRAVDRGVADRDDPAVAAALQRRGTGQPLPVSVRGDMERELRVSLAGVRIHTDSVAAQAARALRAEAFTVGEDIFFAEGSFAPDSRAGRSLLAHELTHVAQALCGRTGGLANGAGVSQPDEPLEQEAAAVASRISSGGDTDVLAATSRREGDDARAAGVSAAAPGRESARAASGSERIFRQQAAIAPSLQSMPPLPASADALHGIELYYLVRTVPRTQGVDTRYLIHAGNFIIAPQMNGVGTPTASVSYYIAYRTSHSQNEYVIGPDSLSEFFARIVELERIANIAYAWGPPPAYARESTLYVRSLLQGRFGDAAHALGRSWLEAVRDPGWWIQVVTATAGAASRVGGATRIRPPPALTVIEGGGGTAVARSAAPMVVGNTALAAAPEVVAAAPPRLSLLINPSPVALPPAIASPPVPAYLAAAATAVGSLAAAGTAPMSVPATAPSPDPDSQTSQAPVVTLYLPAAKVPRIGLYHSLAAERRLVHEAAYARGNPAQVRRWDAALMPGGAEGMAQATFDRGVRMGLSLERILRPNWSRERQTVAMEVDHIVELQVVRASDRGWADTISNYELLDNISNATAGGQLAANIRAERQRLAAQTGDAGWLTRDLVFTQVVPMPGGLGQRWTHEEVQQGVHILVLQNLLGE